jgi:hypothetical protein
MVAHHLGRRVCPRAIVAAIAALGFAAASVAPARAEVPATERSAPADEPRAESEPGAPEAAAAESVPTPGEAPAQEPYDYPAESEPEVAYPKGLWRAPAAAVDLLLVRPAMVVGLGAGAALFVATLPFSAPTLTTDDAARALADQAEATFARPLGAF